jgi:hypothetical protein
MPKPPGEMQKNASDPPGAPQRRHTISNDRQNNEPISLNSTSSRPTSFEAPSSQVTTDTVAPPAPSKESKKEAADRKRRQRRLKKLEKRQEKIDHKSRQLQTIPGQRIFALPKRVHPVSLFIRMGSLRSEQDVIPLEYYDLQSSESSGEETAYFGVTPHPEALITRSMIHLEEGTTPITEEESIETESDKIVASTRRSDDYKRPNSIQLPLQSALKRTDSKGAVSRRPRSLRFLDPKDQKLYEAVSHSDFLRHMHTPGTRDDIGRSLSRLNIVGARDDTSHRVLISSADEGIDLPVSALVVPSRDSSPAPDSDAASHADAELTERSAVDWDPTMEIDTPTLRHSTKSMPILLREATSGESSDISGYEADLEEKCIHHRRGSTTAK